MHGVLRPRAALEALGDLLGVGHLRHPLRADEGRHLDLGEHAVGQQIDQPDLLRGGDGGLLDLHPFAGTELVNDDALGESHGGFPSVR